MKLYGEAVKAARIGMSIKEPAAWTLDATAEKINALVGSKYTKQMLSLIELGKRKPAPMAMEAIKTLLDVDCACPTCGSFYYQEGEV